MRYVLLFLLFAMPAFAQSPYAPLASQNFDEIRRGVETLATSGEPRAIDVLAALQAGQLVVGPGGEVYIKDASGGLTDAATGAAAEAAGPVKPVRVNNAVRRSVDAAMGNLQLFARDPGARRAAAEAVFKARDAAALPALDRAIAKEGDPGVRLVMQQARAATLLTNTDASPADKLAAVATVRTRGDLDARGLLASLSGQPPSVMAAALSAVASIDRELQFWGLLQAVFYGVSLGSVLLLAAAGLAITFGVMGVINMAHGEMVMIGAYVTFVVQQAMRAYVPSLFGASLIVAVPLAFLVAGAIGVLIERCMIRFLYGRPLETLAGDVRSIADPAASGAQHFWADQPGGEHAGLDERRRHHRAVDADL